MTERMDENTTLLNNTTENVNVYPSGYTVPQIIVASILVIIVMIIVIVGNMLVIIAITTEKTLKNIQNWFIASLAVADFSLGLIIMPFSLANELMGYWVFGNWWCDIHSALDVLLCTSSIMNLCLISLDRYWSITQAVDYLKKRTPSRAIFMIAAVWVLSALICIPPLLGWKVDRTSNPNEKFPICQVSEELGYVLYSALGSFYIPSCIMVFVYIRIYYAAKARARRGIRKVNRKADTKKGTTPNITMTSKKPIEQHINNNNSNNNNNQIATIETNNCRLPIQIPTVTCDFASDASTCSDVAIEYQPESQSPQHSLQVKSNEKLEVYTASITVTNQDISKKIKSRQPSTIEIDGISEFEPSSSDSGIMNRCVNIKPLKSRFCKQIFRCAGNQKNRRFAETKIVTLNDDATINDKATELAQLQQNEQLTKPFKVRDPEREKRRIARKKEKRATLILGLIMGAFIACWLPFFTMYILRPVIHVPGFAFSAAFWLGYLNSALNPAIYTIFNKDFRRAFRRILFK